MSHFGKKLLKTAFVLLLIGGSVTYVSTQSAADENARAALQTLETKTSHAADVVGAKTDVVRKHWDRFDVDGKIQTFQHKTRPLAQKVSSTVTPKTDPVFKAVEAGERRMSVPALLLILVFGGVFAFMGISGPSARLGGRY